MKRNIYLQTVDFKEVEIILEKLISNANYQKQKELVVVTDSLSRITFEAVYAKVSSPFYNASAMDGIALKAKSTYEATETTPVIIKENEFIYINTGNEIPEEFDAVVMIEEVFTNDDGTITLYKSARPYQDIRPIGEDIVEGDLVLPRNHKIRPVDISALLSAGIAYINVIKKPLVAIIPTGDEIVSNVKDIKKGTIIDSNSHFMKNELILLGTNPTIFPIQKDEYKILESTIVKASKEYDLVLIGAGSSAGSKDFAKDIVEKNGNVFVHGIGIKPGKPTIIGEINNTPIIGIPGYPVSTYISFDNVVKKVVRSYLSQNSPTKNTIKAKLTKKVYSSLKNYEFIRVKLGLIGNEYVATPLDRGAGVTMSLVKADGLLEIKKNSEGFYSNKEVEITLLKDVNDIKKSLVVVGSHDILLDKVNDLMNVNDYHLSSSHIGSFGGVLAIKSKGCHISPVHILNDDGVYNEFILENYLDNDYVLVRGVIRTQGLYVKKGNPKNITSLKDLKKENITFVNRQRGSGTRMLLDYLLKEEKINPEDIKGYEFELSTHTLVASSVKDDRFDAGIGIMSVAKINNLDFIPLGDEKYDFIVLKEVLETPLYQEFLQTIKSNEFKEALNKIGGYEIHNIGDIIKGNEVN